jgi:hypothetical protein
MKVLASMVAKQVHCYKFFPPVSSNHLKLRLHSFYRKLKLTSELNRHTCTEKQNKTKTKNGGRRQEERREGGNSPVRTLALLALQSKHKECLTCPYQSSRAAKTQPNGL